MCSPLTAFGTGFGDWERGRSTTPFRSGRRCNDYYSLHHEVFDRRAVELTADHTVAGASCLSALLAQVGGLQVDAHAVLDVGQPGEYHFAWTARHDERQDP